MLVQIILGQKLANNIYEFLTACYLSILQKCQKLDLYMNKQKLFIILITYNNGEAITSCLVSLHKQSWNNYRLLIIDNNSQDNTLTIVESFLSKNQKLKSKTQLIKNRENLGFAKANNQGIKIALADNETFAVLLINPDTYFSQNLLQAGIETLKKNPDTGACCPKILYPNKKIWWIGTHIFTRKELFLGSTYSIAKHVNKGETLPSFSKVYKEVQALTGCAMFIRTEIIKKVGLLNEKYFMYAEDIDYSLRLSKACYKLLLFTDATVFHEIKDNRKTLGLILQNIKKYRIYLTSTGQFLLTHQPFWLFSIWVLKLPFVISYSFLKSIYENVF